MQGMWTRSIPDWAAKIPQASGPKNQNIDWKRCINKLNRDFKNDSYQNDLDKPSCDRCWASCNATWFSRTFPFPEHHTFHLQPVNLMLDPPLTALFCFPPGIRLLHSLCQCDASRELTSQTQWKDFLKEYRRGKINTELGSRSQVFCDICTCAFFLARLPGDASSTSTCDMDTEVRLPKSLACSASGTGSEQRAGWSNFTSLGCGRWNG